ncbi:MAG: acyltransferase [Bacteroidales bacterium]|nr:acyltransferase [Candidatus Colimorpha merdihippi]
MHPLRQSSNIPHLTGIRGLAITLVLLFHLNPAIVPQGYYGVDMFFVISGYLLIGRQLQDSTSFSFSHFVQKRLCRLLPPMIATVLVVTLLSILIFPPLDAIDAALSGRKALFSWLNIYLSEATSSYFAENTRSMPMMHLWYMSVLMQCYAFFALLFFLWKKFKCSKRVKYMSLGIVAFLSLCIQFRWCVGVFGGGTTHLSSTYFWSSTRLYEFALGGMAFPITACMCKNKLAPLFASVSLLLLISASFAPLPEGERWTPLAVLLSLCVIIYGTKGLAGSVLNNRVVSYIGTISFSLYLVHWPIICFAEYFFNTPVTGLDILPILTLVAVFSVALYYAVEKRNWKLWVAMVAWLLAVAACSAVPRAYLANVLQKLHPQLSQPAGRHVHKKSLASINEELLLGTESFEVNMWGMKLPDPQPMLIPLGIVDKRASFVIMGDSHASHFRAGFDAVAEKLGCSGVYLNAYFHPFWNSVHVERVAPDHDHTNAEKSQAFLNWLAVHPGIKVVFIGQFWQARVASHHLWDGGIVTEEEALGARIKELRAMCQKMKAIGKHPVIIADTPRIRCKNPDRVFTRTQLYGDFLSRDTKSMETSYEAFMRETAQAQDMFKALEEDGTCIVIHAEKGLFHDGVFQAAYQGQLLLNDDNHLSDAGGIMAIESIADEIARILSTAK